MYRNRRPNLIARNSSVGASERWFHKMSKISSQVLRAARKCPLEAKSTTRLYQDIGRKAPSEAREASIEGGG